MKHNWEYKRLGDVCVVIGGSTPKTDVPEYWNGTLNWFTPAEISNTKYYTESERKITPEAVKASGLTLMPAGTVLLTSRAPIGKVGILTQEGYCNQGFKNFVCGQSLNNEYLYYALIHFNDDIKDMGHGATFKEISKKTTENIQIPVPPIPVQERIVAELDALNGTIAKCCELLATLDSLAQSLFYDTFGDLYTNPKNWDICTLDDVSEKISNGANNKIEADTYKSEGILFFRCQNVWKNRFDLSDVVYIDETTNQKMKGSILKHNDLIVTKIGRLFTENSSLGRVSLYEGEDGKANLSGNLSYIRLKETVCPRFILYILISDYFRDYVRNTTSGGIDKRALNNSQLKALTIYLPPLALQEDFARKIETIEAEKKKVEAIMAELQTLLSSRMDYWFN